MPPAVFLDRDNTLIANDGDLGDPALVRINEGVAEGLRRLHEAGFRLVVVTNQGGVARGKYTEDDVDAVNQEIARQVDEAAGGNGLIDRFYYCPYHPEATVAEYRRDHPWRKPNPGMLLQAARDLGLDLSQSWMIGDQERDVLAGRAAGCRTILLCGREAGGDDAEQLDEDDRGAGVGGDVGAGAGGGVGGGVAVAEPGVRTKATMQAAAFGEAVERILMRARHEAAPGQDEAPAREDERRVVAGRPAEAMGGERSPADVRGLRQAVLDLTEELRAERARRSEFTMYRLTALLCQLGVLLLVLLGLLQLHDFEMFMRWFAGAVVAQLVMLAFLLLDLR